MSIKLAWETYMWLPNTLCGELLACSRDWKQCGVCRAVHTTGPPTELQKIHSKHFLRSAHWPQKRQVILAHNFTVYHVYPIKEVCLPVTNMLECLCPCIGECPCVVLPYWVQHPSTQGRNSIHLTSLWCEEMAKFDPSCSASVGCSHDPMQRCMCMWPCWPYMYVWVACCTCTVQVSAVLPTVKGWSLEQMKHYMSQYWHFETISFISSHCCEMSYLTNWWLENDCMTLCMTACVWLAIG